MMLLEHHCHGNDTFKISLPNGNEYHCQRPLAMIQITALVINGISGFFFFSNKRWLKNNVNIGIYRNFYDESEI